MIANYVFEPKKIPSCPIVGSSSLFPVRRILCVGANYAAHQLEMGRDPSRALPFFFAKPSDAIVVADKNLNIVIIDISSNLIFFSLIVIFLKIIN